MTDRLPFFVYGTLRSGQGNARVLPPSAKHTPAVAPGVVLFTADYGAFPYALYVGDPSMQAVGELIEVSPLLYPQTLKDLDMLEGVAFNHYSRERVEVLMPGDQRVIAWIYLVTAETALGYDRHEIHYLNDTAGVSDWVTYRAARRPAQERTPMNP